MPKISVGESFTVALISGIEKVWIRGGGGVSRSSVENFLSHSAENLPRRTLYCCINFGYRKSLEKRGGGIKIFRRKFFCVTVPKNSVGEPFIVALISGIEKVWIRGGDQDFPWKIFLSHSAEKFRRRTLYCCINFGYRKSLDKGGGSRFSVENFFVSQCRKIS